MFGISPLGWVHTLGSLPAIPVALYMFLRYGRIVPRSIPGSVYLVSMLIGAATVFLVAHQAISDAIGVVTLLVLVAGYGTESVLGERRAARYIETIALTISAFLLMLPTVSETLRRVPDGHPIVTDMHAPLLVGVQVGLLLLLIVGLAAQIFVLARQGRAQRPRYPSNTAA
jgi:hypothetical protein